MAFLLVKNLYGEVSDPSEKELQRPVEPPRWSKPAEAQNAQLAGPPADPRAEASGSDEAAAAYGNSGAAGGDGASGVGGASGASGVGGASGASGAGGGAYSAMLQNDEAAFGQGRGRRSSSGSASIPRTNLPRTEIKTVEQAYMHCFDVAERQIEKAKLENVPPNEQTHGDAAAKRLITSLLPSARQKELFLKLSEKEANWPRLRALFGAPPYHFLETGAMTMFRAGGFSSKRANMTYDSNKPPNYSQFGTAHFRDDAEREYRVDQQNANDDALPDLSAAAGTLVLSVRIPKRSRQTKAEIIKSGHRERLVFPRAGEVLRLEEEDGIARLLGKQKDRAKQKQNVKVVAVRRVPNAMTASIACQIVA